MYANKQTKGVLFCLFPHFIQIYLNSPLEVIVISHWPRLGQLVLVYGGSQWSSDLIPGVEFPKQINKC